MSEDFILEYKLEYLNLNNEQIINLSGEIVQALKDSYDLTAMSVFSYDGKQSIVIAKDKANFSNINQVGQIVSELNPRLYFDELPDEIEYRGAGHMPFAEFEIYFAKIKKDLVIAFLATDIHRIVFEKAKEIIENIKEALDKKTPVEDKKKEKKIEQIPNKIEKVKNKAVEKEPKAEHVEARKNKEKKAEKKSEEDLKKQLLSKLKKL